MSGPSRDKSVQSVHRAISILQVIAREGALGVTDIARELDIHKSTISRLIATLESRGLVEQTSHRGQYRLDYGMAQLAQGVTKKHDLNLSSRAVYTELAEQLGETVNIAVREGHSIVTVDQVIGSAQVTSVNWVGRHQAMHATASGKLFLAHFSASELADYLNEPMERFTDNTITDPALMREELERIREVGYAEAVEELEPGLTAIAAPIREHGGQVIATLNASGPSFRLSAEATPAVAEQVIAAAGRISELNGFPRVG